MKRKTICTAIAVLLSLCLYAQISMPNYKLAALYRSHVIQVDANTYAPKLLAEKIINKTFNTFEFPDSEGKIVSYVNIPSKYKAFDPKKDDINNYCFRKNTVNGVEVFTLYILHKNGKACDMNEFSVRIDGDNLKCKQSSDGNMNLYYLGCSIFDLADGTNNLNGKIIVTHIASGSSVSIPYRFAWYGYIRNLGNDCTFMITPVKSNIGEPVCAALDLSNGDLFILKGKMGINVQGRNGKNGANGANGINGTNTYTYTDKKGVTHTVSGTWGTRGGNGGNGGDGQDGGNLLVLLDENLSADQFTFRYSGGKGGKGGIGGQGGRHGNGSGLKGYAANGYNGKDGKDGQNGSAISIRLPLTSYFDTFMDSVEVSTTTPYIVTDVSQKVHRGNKKKKVEQDKKDAAADAVEF